MKVWVGVTDNDWFRQLSRVEPDEVNFWRGSRTFRVLQPGEPFLFKLHAPHNFIVGGGFFVRHSALPASLAWEAFEKKNGVASFEELRARIRRYRPNDETLDPIIGCNVLVDPFFFDRGRWIPIPADFALNIVTGKTYDTAAQEGRLLWEAVRRNQPRTLTVEEPALASEDPNDERFGEAYLATVAWGRAPSECW